MAGLFISYHLFHLMTLPLESLDDLMILYRAKTQSVSDIFTTTFLQDNSGFYRPFIGFLTKILLLFSISDIPFRAFQLVLTLGIFILIYQFFRKRQIPIQLTLIGLLCLISLPTTRSAFFWFSDIGSLIIIFLFLLSLLGMNQRNIFPVSLSILISIFALLTKELGLVLVFMHFIYYTYHKKLRYMGLLVSIVGGYFLIRYNVVGALGSPNLFQGSSGLWGTHYTTEELMNMFGEFPLWFYIYNVFAQFSSIFFYFPTSGKFTFSTGSIVAASPLILSSSVLIFYLVH